LVWSHIQGITLSYQGQKIAWCSSPHGKANQLIRHNYLVRLPPKKEERKRKKKRLDADLELEAIGWKLKQVLFVVPMAIQSPHNEQAIVWSIRSWSSIGCTNKDEIALGHTVICFFLSSSLPENWRLVGLELLSQAATAKPLFYGGDQLLQILFADETSEIQELDNILR